MRRWALKTHLIPFVVVCVGAVVVQVASATGKGAALLQSEWTAAYLVAGAFLFGSSSLFHLAEGTPLEEGMNKLDHFGIHVQIAATGIIHMNTLPAIARSRVFLGLNAVTAMETALVVLVIAGMAIRAIRGDRTGRTAYVVYGLMALTVPFVLDYHRLFDHAAMRLTLAALAVYTLSALVLFPRERLHALWHLGVVTGWLLAGAAIVVALA